MTLTIGRVVIAKSPRSLSYDGDGLQVAGKFYGSSLTHAKVIRQQMLGLAGNEDEPVVPVTWDGDTDLDGYYAVGGVNVTPVKGVTYQQFGFDYAIQLERVQGGFAAPLCEVSTSIALRTNAHSITTSTGRVGVPAAAAFQRGVGGSGAAVVSTTQNPRNSATGDVGAFGVTTTEESFAAVSFTVAPTDFYDGAATIEQSIGGTWYPVVGDQIGIVTGNALRIGNGLVRMTYHTDGIMSTELWDGSVWESATSFELVGSVSDEWLPAGGWRVLKNAADACSVQTAIIPTDQVNGLLLPRTVSLHIERYRMLVEIAADGLYFVWGGSSTVAEDLKLQAATPTAASSLTGSLRQASNDANGHKWVMFSPSTTTNDTTNGSMTIAAPASALIGQFGLGWERDGTTGAAQYDQTVMSTEYFAALGTRQRVVAR